MATAKKATGTAVAVQKKTGTAVVSIQERIKALAEKNKDKVNPAGGNAIRVTQDKHLQIPGGEEVEEMDVVIVDFVSTQNFYPDGYDPKNIVPPDCFAIGENPKNLKPSPNSPNIQVDLKKGQGCNDCKQFQWGSDPKGGDGKACKSGRKMAVLPPKGDDESDEDYAETPMMTLTASPTAIKRFDGFIGGLNRIGSIPVAVVVNVSCDPAVKHASLMFRDPQPNGAVEVGLNRMEEAASLLAVEPDVSQWAEKKKAKPARGRAR